MPLHMQALVDENPRKWRARDASVLMSDPDTGVRTAWRKTTSPFRLSNKGHGLNEDSWEPLRYARRLFFVCGKNGCSALVQALHAYKAAKAKRRSKLKPGDGCSSRCCVRGRQRNPSRFKEYQRASAASIANGTYFLIRRPRVIRPKKVMLAKSADAVAAANTVLALS